MKLPKGLNYVETYIDIADDIYLLKVGNLYNTEIYKEFQERIKLNSGGYKSNHTKKCINLLLPDNIFVFQKEFNWYVCINDKTVNFVDNMIIKIKGV